MLVVGYLSFYIAFVSIPLVYLIIGFGLNLLYTSGWIIEITIIQNFANNSVKLKFPKYFFLSYLILSIIVVFGYSISMLMR